MLTTVQKYASFNSLILITFKSLSEDLPVLTFVHVRIPVAKASYSNNVCFQMHLNIENQF